MPFTGAVRVVAMGIVLAIVTACGGGGGSGGGEGGTTANGRPIVGLPDTSTATQKILTQANAKQVLILALNTISFVEDGNIPVSSAIDFYADSFAESDAPMKASSKLRTLRPAQRTINVSDDLCVSGSATVEAGNNLVGKMVQRYRNCDMGAVIFDGDVELNVRKHTSGNVLTDVTYTFRGLRVTYDQDDTVFDGNVEMTTDYPGTGFVAADLEIRDLIALKGMRVVGYRADFDIDSRNDLGNYVYKVRQLKGRLYDGQGEYFDLALTPGHEPWPMLVGKNSSLTLSPSGMPAPYQVKIALDTSDDHEAKHWLLVGLDELSNIDKNGVAPEFHLDGIPVRLDKNEMHEVKLGNVTDADQQFVNVSWQLVAQPVGSSPAIAVSENGFDFSSGVAGDYRFLVTGNDGLHSVTSEINIRVMYDVPQVSIDVPALVDSGSQASFSVMPINSEGTVRIVPLALPGLLYDASTGVATYAALLPEFASEQQVNVGFVISNEDRQHVVTTSVTVRAQPDRSGPMLIAASQYVWSETTEWVGQFTASASKDVIRNRGGLIDVFEIEGADKSYRESYDLTRGYHYYEVIVRAVQDVDGDGFDDILFGVRADDGVYHLGVYDARRRRNAAETPVADFNPASPVNIVDMADLNADGDNEIVLFSGSRFYVFDASLRLQWKSTLGSYGNHLVVANIDNDSALELVTESGYIVDGATYVTQMQGNFSAIGNYFFAADLNGDDIDEVYLANAAVLQKMTPSGYVNHTLSGSVESNIVVSNIDSDAEDEVLFITFDTSGPQNPPWTCWTPWIWGTKSLAALNLDNGDYVLSIIRGFEQGCSTDRQLLVYDDVDGDAGLEYMLQLSVSAPRILYKQDTNSTLSVTFSGPVLQGSFAGGAPISADGDRRVFCGGMVRTQLDGKDDIFTVSMASGFIKAEQPWFPSDSSSQPSQWGLDCTSIALGDALGFGIISMGDVYEGGVTQLMVHVQDADTGESIAVTTLPGADSNRLAIDDVDGDGDKDIVIAGRTTLPVYGSTDVLTAIDISVGATVTNFPLTGQYLSQLAIGNVIPGNSGSEVVVLVQPHFSPNCKLQILGYEGLGSLELLREVTLAESCLDFDKPIIADFDGDNDSEVLLSRFESPESGGLCHRVRVYGTDLRLKSEWSVSGYINSFTALKLGNGATMLASLERDSYYANASIVWRDGLGGSVIYQSPEIAGSDSVETVFFDAGPSKVRAVVTASDRIYITQ